jgi:hypothetical protein
VSFCVERSILKKTERSETTLRHSTCPQCLEIIVKHY